MKLIKCKITTSSLIAINIETKYMYFYLHKLYLKIDFLGKWQEFAEEDLGVVIKYFYLLLTFKFNLRKKLK